MQRRRDHHWRTTFALSATWSHRPASQQPKTLDASGFSDIATKIFRCSGRTPGRYAELNSNYGLRWDAQRFPDPVVPPAQTSYGQY